MANKSYASSEVGGDESRFHEEVQKDFGAAYNKVIIGKEMLNFVFQLVEKMLEDDKMKDILLSQHDVYKFEHVVNN